MVTCTRATRACARAHAHCWHNWNSLDALHAMQHLAVRGHFSCSAVMAVLGPRNRSEMVTCTRATRACARAHAHCWHNWNSLDALHAMQHLAVRGHFSCSAVMAVLGPRNRSEMVTCTRAARACSRAHAHCWHGWEIPVRGHFSTPKQQHDHIYTHACARAHQHGHIYTHACARTHTPLAQLV